MVFSDLEGFSALKHILTIVKRFLKYIDWDNGKVIKTSKNDFIRKLNEAIAIRSSDENLLLNKNCGEFMPYIWNKFILKI